MKVDIPYEVHDILIKFEKAGFEIYLAGGVVRDILMKRLTYDWDFTTNATPKEIQKVLPDSYYNNIYGTVGLPSEIKDQRPYEITTFRFEYGYSDARRPDKVEWGKTLEQDLERRDFTINAMALKAKSLKSVNKKKGKSSISIDFEIIDPYKGQEDVKKRLIRAVRDPNERFSEDALRMMRAIRIASELNFSIEKETFQAIQKNSKLINKIAKERVRDELLKTLKSPSPEKGMKMFKESGLMQEVLPEMIKTFGVEQKSPQRHHIYDVGTHSLMSLKHCKSEDPIVRLATFIHDIGKPQTYKKLPNGVITFYNHEVVSTAIARRIAERLRFSKKTNQQTCYSCSLASVYS